MPKINVNANVLTITSIQLITLKCRRIADALRVGSGKLPQKYPFGNRDTLTNKSRCRTVGVLYRFTRIVGLTKLEDWALAIELSFGETSA